MYLSGLVALVVAPGDLGDGSLSLSDTVSGLGGMDWVGPSQAIKLCGYSTSWVEGLAYCARIVWVSDECGYLAPPRPPSVGGALLSTLIHLR